MGRKADSPTPKWSDEHGCWVVRVTKPRPAHLKPGQESPRVLVKLRTDTITIGKDEVARAERYAKIAVKQVRAGKVLPEEDGETVDQWFERWLAARETKGNTSTRSDRGRYAKWVSPIIGSKPIAKLTRLDVEEVVQHLDREVLRFDRATRTGLRWKTALNAWAVVSKMMADSCRSKLLGLRVREDNPARDVQGPDRGIERSGPFVYPREFQALMACERVPARWKRIFMITTYLYMRGGEVEAVAWEDVNLDQRYVLVHHSSDEEGELKSCKADDTRKVAIEPTLLPLLLEMHARARGEGNVITAMPPRESWAERLRKYLRWAGVDRADLYADDATRRPLTFHDLRHSGITWRAVRGDDPLKIMRAAGHDDLETTQNYINEAETFDPEAFGTPFPAIPLELFSDLDGFGLDTGSDTGSDTGAEALRNELSTRNYKRPQGGSANQDDVLAITLSRVCGVRKTGILSAVT